MIKEMVKNAAENFLFYRDAERTFFEPQEFPWVPAVEAEWETVRKELDELMLHRDEIPNFQDYSPIQLDGGIILKVRDFVPVKHQFVELLTNSLPFRFNGRHPGKLLRLKKRPFSIAIEQKILCSVLHHFLYHQIYSRPSVSKRDKPTGPHDPSRPLQVSSVSRISDKRAQ